MKITIEFDTDNAAFEDAFGAEVDYVFRQARDRVLDGGKSDDSHRLRDSNGNTIGQVRFS